MRAKDEAMSKPTDPDRSIPASRVPQSGRKFIDPTKYQMDTVPAELVAKIAQMKIESMPEEALKPPPLYDERPVIGRLRRLGVRMVRYKIPLLFGILIGLCVVITMAVMGQGSTSNAKRAVEAPMQREIVAEPMVPTQVEPSHAVDSMTAEPPNTQRPPSVAPVQSTRPEEPTVTPRTNLSTNRKEPSSTTSPSIRAATAPAKTSEPRPDGTDIMDAPFARKKAKPAPR